MKKVWQMERSVLKRAWSQLKSVDLAARSSPRGPGINECHWGVWRSLICQLSRLAAKNRPAPLVTYSVLFWTFTKINVHTKFELDWVNTFSDNGQKPIFLDTFWPPEGQNLANLAQSESILNTHPISVHTMFELDCMNTFSDDGRKPPF